LEKISHIAIPYARALFDFTMEKDVLEIVWNDMQTLGSLCKSNREFLLMLKSPILKTHKKQKIITAVFGGSFSRITLGFLRIIISKRRESLLPDIVLAFIGFYKEYKGILTTVVKTATPLTDAVRKQILEIMKTQTNGTVDLVEEIKEDLIGGFVLQWKDMQYDASILNQMQKMKREMANLNLYTKGF
jgi:F-type H+-transporting ATPase subunit delta